MAYQLICMSLDGDYVTEGRDFETIESAWGRFDDMGSRWYFYPFPFVMSASGKTVVDTPELLQHLKRKRLVSVVKHFAEVAKQPEMANTDAETFAFAL